MYDLQLETSYSTPYATINTTLLNLILLSMVGQKHTPNVATDIEDEYDYIVVGAGTAGSVVASRLSEESCVKILLLEAGKSSPKLTDIPAIYTFFSKSDLDWSFETVPQRFPGTESAGRRMTLSAGKAIGGSSIINGMQNIRGHKKDFDIWSENGAAGWSFDEILPYFKKLENNVDSKYIANGYHGTDGPVTISTPPYDSELKVAIYEAIGKMGYNITDANGPKQSGFYDFQATMKDGQRCSTAKGYLVPNENKENLHIVANAFVKKIVIEENKAKGVVFDFQGRTREVKAKKEVILSAGTINSAKLLMLSGVGPSEELEKHGISVKANLSVGRNLQEQWGVLLDFELDSEIKSFSAKIRDNSSIWAYITNKTGPLTSLSGVSNMAFLSISGYPAPDDYPDYELYVGEGMNERPFHNRAHQHCGPLPAPLSSKTRSCSHSDPQSRRRSLYSPERSSPFFWCLSQILHPKARGSVTLNSTDPYDPPVIDPNYFAHREDIDVVVAGLRKCQELGTSEDLRSIGSQPFSKVIPGCEEFLEDDDAYFRCMAQSVFITCSHHVGTVKMGSVDDPTAVLDPQLRVKGIENLRVADASVMPTITSGNFIPAIMIGEKASDMIKQTFQCNQD